MCGRPGELLTAEIEGAEMKVCPKCSKFGKVISGNFGWPIHGKNFPSRPKLVREAPEFKLVDNFSEKIRKARENRNLSQEEFARLINEKESISSKWERGEFKPSIETARKLEKILGLVLVVKEENPAEKIEQDKKSGELTLGDFVKVRKRN